MLGHERPCELLAAPAEALNPLLAHRREVGRIRVGFLPGYEIGRPELESAIVDDTGLFN